MLGISIRRLAAIAGAVVLTLALLPAGAIAVNYDPPKITSASSAAFTTGVAGSFTVTTTGYPVPSINDPGAILPTGVNFTDNGNGTATLSGTPAVGTSSGSPYRITFTATNGVSPSASQSFTLNVNASGSPTITSLNHATFPEGLASTFTVTTTGAPVPAIGDSGASLPSGLTFHDNGNGTATLSGTPAVGTSSGSPYSITFTAANGISPSASQIFTLTVTPAGAPTITSASSATFPEGLASSFTVTTTGSPVPAIGDSGASLPSGLTFHDNGNGTATLYGTPAVGTSSGSPYSITFTAANGISPSASQVFTLTITASANHLYFATQPGGGAAGAVWTQQPVVEVLNSLNQVVTSDSSTYVYLSIATNPAGGTLSCTSGTTVRVVNGYAYFSGCSINIGSASYYTLTATSSPVWTPATSSAFYVGGSSETLYFATQPGGGAAGAVWTQQPVVEVLNSLNQVVTSDSSTYVYLSIATNPAGGTLSCTSGTTVRVVNGYAYFSGCSINIGSASYYTLTATSSPVWTPATSSAFYVGGSSETLYFATQPGGGAAGAVWTQQPVVEVLNSLNQVVTSDSSTYVYLSIATNPAGGTLSCTSGTTVRVVNGYAYFSGCSINIGSASYYTLTATSSPVWTPATSSAFYVSAGAQAKLAISSSSALGLKPSSGFTTKTPKVTTVGQYVTWQFAGGAALAGQRVNVLVATKANGIWGQPKYLKSAWADANGIVTFARRLTSAGAINVRVQLYGSRTYATSYSTPLGAYWK